MTKKVYALYVIIRNNKRAKWQHLADFATLKVAKECAQKRYLCGRIDQIQWFSLVTLYKDNRVLEWGGRCTYTSVPWLNQYRCEFVVREQAAKFAPFSKPIESLDDLPDNAKIIHWLVRDEFHRFFPENRFALDYDDYQPDVRHRFAYRVFELRPDGMCHYTVRFMSDEPMEEVWRRYLEYERKNRVSAIIYLPRLNESMDIVLAENIREWIDDLVVGELEKLREVTRA